MKKLLCIFAVISGLLLAAGSAQAQRARKPDPFNATHFSLGAELGMAYSGSDSDFGARLYGDYQLYRNLGVEAGLLFNNGSSLDVLAVMRPGLLMNRPGELNNLSLRAGLHLMDGSPGPLLGFGYELDMGPGALRFTYTNYSSFDGDGSVGYFSLGYRIGLNQFFQVLTR